MRELLESYLSGNISYVKEELARSDCGYVQTYNFTELFSYYIDNYSPSTDDLKLFVSRLN